MIWILEDSRVGSLLFIDTKNITKQSKAKQHNTKQKQNKNKTKTKAKTCIILYDVTMMF